LAGPLAKRFCVDPARRAAMNAPGRDPNEALSALERLYQKKVVTLEEAQAAVRFITGDESATFPPPAPPPAPAPPSPVSSGTEASALTNGGAG